MENKLINSQIRICEENNVVPDIPLLTDKIGISKIFKADNYPIHGLRHTHSSGESGWYVWSGEYEEIEDFFSPYHLLHIPDKCKIILPYLGLPSGWRFLLAPSHEDIWFDDKLI